MKILHLTLKKKWFDMIFASEKTEEYRDPKPYWWSRLTIAHPLSVIAGGDIRDRHSGRIYSYRAFDIIRFTNGYAKDAPTFDIECLAIKYDTGKQEWGAVPESHYFVIKLGKVLSTSNIPA